MRNVITSRALLVTALILVLSGCDVPTEPPNFGFETSARTPLLFDETFTLFGSGTSEHEALLDTSLSEYDTLFAVHPENQTLRLVEEIEDLNLGELDEALPALDLPATDFSVSMASIARQSIATSYGESIGTIERPELTVPSLPIRIEGQQVFAPVNEFIIAPETVDLLEFGEVTIDQVSLTRDTDEVNALSFTLDNGLSDHHLTDGNGQAPVMVLEDGSGTALAQQRFDRAPAPGDTATATISLAGQSVPTDLAYRLVLSTPDGFQPVKDNQFNVRVKTVSAPFHYRAVTLARLPQQDELTFSESNLSLTDDPSFNGFITSSASFELDITNRFAFDLTLDELTASNVGAVGSYTDGHTFLQDGGYTIPANGTKTISIDLGSVPISNEVNFEALASTPGTSNPVSITAEDGLDLDLSGSVSVSKVFLQPRGFSFSEGGRFSLDDIEKVRFESADDFVEFKQGTLQLSDLRNELDIRLDTTILSLPSLRTPPYRPQDSVVVRFAGSRRDPANFTFPAITRKDGPRDLSLDLSELRLYPTGNAFSYHLHAVSETSDDVRTLHADDEIGAQLSAENVEVQEAAAHLSPFTTALTDDADGSGTLDVLHDAEAETVDLSVDALDNLQVENLQLEGSEFVLNVTTNVTTDVSVYAALAGVTSSGKHVYLGGKGEHAVQTDSLSADFTANGTSLSSDKLIKLSLKGAPSPDQPVTRTLTLNAENSTIDAFISALPQQLRFAGKALARAEGGRVHLRQPITLEPSLGVSLPLAFRGDFSVQPSVDADLSALSDLTNDDEPFTVNTAKLMLDYENGLPVGFDFRLDVLGAGGTSLLTLPAPEKEPLVLNRASKASNGTARAAQDGTLELSLSKEDLRALSKGRQMRLQLTFDAPDQETAHLRSTDALRLGLKGIFDLRVQSNK